MKFARRDLREKRPLPFYLFFRALYTSTTALTYNITAATVAKNINPDSIVFIVFLFYDY